MTTSKPMSQSKKILQYLKRHPNTWIPMTTLAMEGECYAVHSRISDIRKMGYDIENKTEYVNGKKRSYYKLIQNYAKVETEFPFLERVG